MFCWAKFMDADFSPEHRKFNEEHADVLTAGWMTTAEQLQRRGLLLDLRYLLQRLPPALRLARRDVGLKG